tara:strand:+ start:80 stop:430 length:351 start_codon:yes stop_codon:yes gene_type:complete
MAQDQNIIQDAIDRDVANGTLRPRHSTYDVHIEIDIDCEELLDATGLDYLRSEDDDTQNVVIICLNEDEFCDVFETVQLAKANEQTFASRILNPELGEYTTKVTVYTPHGDKITFE